MKRISKCLLLVFFILIVTSCGNKIERPDVMSAQDMEIDDIINRTTSEQEIVLQHNQSDDEHNSFIDENPQYIDDVQNDEYHIKYSSEDQRVVVYVDNIDFSRTNNIEFALEYNGDKKILPLCAEANSLVDVTFLDMNRIAVTGHINPSLLSHEIFDMDTGDLLGCYYGVGFVYDEAFNLYYIVPQPHWVGMDERGGNKIMNAQGDILYETEPNVEIYGDLWVDSDQIYFMERLADPERDDIEPEQKSIQIDR